MICKLPRLWSAGEKMMASRNTSAYYRLLERAYISTESYNPVKLAGGLVKTIKQRLKALDDEELRRSGNAYAYSGGYTECIGAQVAR
jgi:hypothetical protein